MADRFLYLAGPISDCNLNEATYWRDYVKERLALNIVGVSPMREKGAEVAPNGKIPGDAKQFNKTLMSNERAIYTRDKYDCTNADGIFAYLPKLFNDRRPSIGTLIELGWANANDVPIILVTDDDYYINHPILARCVGWTVNDLDEGIEVANAVWGAYASRPVAQIDMTSIMDQCVSYIENRNRTRPPALPQGGQYYENAIYQDNHAPAIAGLAPGRGVLNRVAIVDGEIIYQNPDTEVNAAPIPQPLRYG